VSDALLINSSLSFSYFQNKREIMWIEISDEDQRLKDKIQKLEQEKTSFKSQNESERKLITDITRIIANLEIETKHYEEKYDLIKKDLQKNENRKESIQIEIKNMSDQVEALENDLITAKLESESINVALTDADDKAKLDLLQYNLLLKFIFLYPML
jgi:chromosome segregation ATPase